MSSYLEQITVSHRPASVVAYSLALRHLAAYVTATDPNCVTVAEIGRSHIEGFKLAFAARPGLKGAMSTTTIRHNLGMIRTFFERIIDWDWDDAPRRVPIFAGDVPKADEPTPKFLDDPTAAKFMATLAVDPDRRRRLLVELLARTGMRAGEVGGVRDDAVFRVGDRWWLRVPLGKLHNDRNVPLHPLLVGLISDYQAWAGTVTKRVPARTRRRPALRSAHHPPLRGACRQTSRHRKSSSAPAPAHTGYPVPQPRDEPRGHRRLARGTALRE